MPSSLPALTDQDVSKIDSTEPIREEFKVGARLQELTALVESLEVAGTPAGSAVRFVDFSAAAGGNGSAASPFADVQAAVDSFDIPGDLAEENRTNTIFITGGESSDNVVCPAFYANFTIIILGSSKLTGDLTWQPEASIYGASRLPALSLVGLGGADADDNSVALPVVAELIVLDGNEDSHVTLRNVQVGLVNSTAVAMNRTTAQDVFVFADDVAIAGDMTACQLWDVKRSTFLGNQDSGFDINCTSIRNAQSCTFAPVTVTAAGSGQHRDCLFIETLSGGGSVAFDGPAGSATWDSATCRRSFGQNAGAAQFANGAGPDDFVDDAQFDPRYKQESYTIKEHASPGSLGVVVYCTREDDGWSKLYANMPGAADVFVELSGDDKVKIYHDPDPLTNQQASATVGWSDASNSDLIYNGVGGGDGLYNRFVRTFLGRSIRLNYTSSASGLYVDDDASPTDRLLYNFGDDLDRTGLTAWEAAPMIGHVLTNTP